MEIPYDVIFYDEASKGNPGVSRAGGLVYSLDIKSSISFSWGLGSMSNNQAEGYTLMMEIHLLMNQGYNSVQFFGDSKILIKDINTTNRINNYALNIILQRIRILLKGLDKAAFFNILREHNHLADDLANKACLLPQGFLSINGEDSHFHPIP